MIIVSALAIASLSAFGDDKPKPQATPAERLAALQKEYEAADKTFYAEYRKLTGTDPEAAKKKDELYKAYDKAKSDRFMAAVDLAKADPSTETAFAALEWVLTIPRAYYLPPGKPAMELMAQYHAANPKIGKTIAWLGFYRPTRSKSEDAAMALIRAVAEKNPERAAKAQAVMALAWDAKEKYETADYKKSADVEQLAMNAEKAFEKVAKDYADVARLMIPGQKSLGEEANRELFELRNLRAGKPAPEITGEDLDGVKFKLSDYRGKVVVLDFWGDW